MPNVNGPSGPRGPASTTGPTPSSTPKTSLPDAPAPQPNRGWGPTAQGVSAPRGDGFGGAPAPRGGPSLSGNSQPLNLNLPDLGGVPAPAQPANAYQGQVAKAVDKLTQSLDDTLKLDPSAMDLAKGVRPWQNGDPLSADQQNKLQSATADFFKSIPIGALSPQLAQEVESSLKGAGLPVDGLADKSLDQLGSVGSDIARSLASKLKQQSPAAYYGLAAAGAAVVGYEAYAGGSDALKKLGVKPEVSKGFFDDQLKLKLGATWDPHFQNVDGNATLSTHVKLNDDWRLSGSATYDVRKGFEGATGGVQYDNHDNLTGSANVTLDSRGLESVNGTVTYRPSDDLRLSASVTHDFRTDRTTATAEADWQVRKNVDFALSGSYDSQGNSQVGAGLKISF